VLLHQRPAFVEIDTESRAFTLQLADADGQGESSSGQQVHGRTGLGDDDGLRYAARSRYGINRSRVVCAAAIPIPRRIQRICPPRFHHFWVAQGDQ
jgi:hypothetical protein